MNITFEFPNSKYLSSQANDGEGIWWIRNAQNNTKAPQELGYLARDRFHRVMQGWIATTDRNVASGSYGKLAETMIQAAYDNDIHPLPTALASNGFELIPGYDDRWFRRNRRSGTIVVDTSKGLDVERLSSGGASQTILVIYRENELSEPATWPQPMAQDPAGVALHMALAGLKAMGVF